METPDIRQLLAWQGEAARKARRAGFDIVYVYAGMGYLPYEFLLSEWNQRTDAYGGSVANRVRFVRELLEVTHEAVQRQVRGGAAHQPRGAARPTERGRARPRRTKWSACSPSCPTSGT